MQSSDNNSSGIIYIAFGSKFIEEAVHSARTAKMLSPQIQITLFADFNPQEECFDKFIPISPGHKRCKVDYIDQTPYRDTIYLDTDTKIVFPIESMFSILDRFDLAACQDFCRKRKKMSDLFQEYKNIPYEFSEYNSGVIVFRNNTKTQRFFADWRRWFYKTENAVGGWDQPSFRVALWNSDLRIHTLPPEFNVRSLSQQRRAHRRRKNPTTPEVLHPRILHWRGVGRPKILFFKRHYRASKY